MKKENEKQQKITAMGSMKGKLILLFILVTAIVVTMYTVLIMPSIKDNIRTIYDNYLLDLADSFGSEIDLEISYIDPDILSKPEGMAAIAQEVVVENVSSAYAYIVSHDGNMLYHPTADKIGQPVENEAVQSLTQRLASGENIGHEVVTYNYQGMDKIAASYVSDNGFIFVVTADDKDLLAPAVRLEMMGIGIAVALMLAGAIVAFFVVSHIVKPLQKVVGCIDRIAKLDLTTDNDLMKYLDDKSEVGAIVRSIHKMKRSLKDIVTQINQECESLYHASETLSENAQETSGNVDNVEVAVNEIATGATSQANETQRATENIVTMGTMIEDTTSEVNSLNEVAGGMSNLTGVVRNTLEELGNINQKAIESINIIYEQTNTTNESAQKIKDATVLIASIAEETNLLSLNASIEAARAGEAGKGFAVVASQIQKLAEQSNESTKRIDDIIAMLLADSENAVHTMDEVRRIMDQQNEKVMQTGQLFTEVSEGIEQSVQGMGTIADHTTRLDEARNSIVDMVQSLTAIAQQNAASTEETSASVMEIGSVMMDISENAERLKEIANILETSMEQFKLD